MSATAPGESTGYGNVVVYVSLRGRVPARLLRHSTGSCLASDRSLWSARMTVCPFCRIVAGELPSSPVLETDLILAILDIRPANPGHTLVIPRRHVESFTELNGTEVEQLALCGQQIGGALKQGLDDCEAVTFSLADGAAAGQDVPHTHLHVVPRRSGDGLGWRAAGPLQDRGTLDAIASQLRTTLGLSSARTLARHSLETGR